MTTGSRGLDAPVTALFKKRFFLLFALIHAFAGAFFFLALFVALSKPFTGDYSAVFIAVRELASVLLPTIVYAGLVYILLVSVATTALCVSSLHKIAGPLYRMERVIESYLAGEVVKPAFFRDGDQVRPLALSFNALIGHLREERKKLLGLMEHAERLCLQDRATCRLEMEKALAELEVMLAKYR